MADVKFCKDCRFFQPNRAFSHFGFLTAAAYKWARCTHPSVLTEEAESLVTGKSDTACRTARAIDRLCGREGRYWEAA